MPYSERLGTALLYENWTKKTKLLENWGGDFSARLWDWKEYEQMDYDICKTQCAIKSVHIEEKIGWTSIYPFYPFAP
jgi:hypothetical protein